MATTKATPASKEPAKTEEAAQTAAAPASAVPQDVTVPVEVNAQAAAAPASAVKVAPISSVPEHLRKGNRVCAACLKTEASFLEKNPRYSLCQGVDVLCYRKGDRVFYNVSLADVNAKYPDKVGKTDDQGRALIAEVDAPGIKKGILVRGAVSYKKVTVDNAATATQQVASTPASAPASGEGTGSATPTTSG